MFNKINIWARGIIIAIVIGTVLEMIIPENKNKKYIKIIMGIYVLFCIINPVVGNQLNLDDFSLNNYIEINQTVDNANQNYDSNVKKMFNEKIKTSIKQKLNSCGYESNNIEVVSDDNYNILSVNIYNVYEYKKDNGIVNKIDISIKEKPAMGIANSDKEKIKRYIMDSYNVEEENINIS